MIQLKQPLKLLFKMWWESKDSTEIRQKHIKKVYFQMFQMQIREYKGELQKPQNLDSPARIKSSHAGPLWI